MAASGNFKRNVMLFSLERLKLWRAFNVMFSEKRERIHICMLFGMVLCCRGLGSKICNVPIFNGCISSGCMYAICGWLINWKINLS